MLDAMELESFCHCWVPDCFANGMYDNQLHASHYSTLKLMRSAEAEIETWRNIFWKRGEMASYLLR